MNENRAYSAGFVAPKGIKPLSQAPKPAFYSLNYGANVYPITEPLSAPSSGVIRRSFPSVSSAINNMPD